MVDRRALSVTPALLSVSDGSWFTPTRSASGMHILLQRGDPLSIALAPVLSPNPGGENMASTELHVRSVRGRYPHKGILRPENLVVSAVREVGRVFQVRLDDARHQDF